MVFISHFSSQIRRLLEGGVYKRAVFKRGNSVKYFMSVRSAGIILWWWWSEGGSHEIFTNREGRSTIFLLLPGGIKNLTESFILFLPPPPRELKNDNSLDPQFYCLLVLQISFRLGGKMDCWVTGRCAAKRPVAEDCLMVL